MSPAQAPPALHRGRTRELRLMLVGLTITLWAVALGTRLVHIQVFARGSFERQAARQSERTINLDPRRGPILDRDGHALALSVEAESVYAVPQDVQDPRATVAALGRALGLDAQARKDLVAKLQGTRAFVWVKRKIDPDTARTVKDLQLDGIGFLTETRRWYPKRQLAAHVIGYVGLDNQGMAGIEYAFEESIGGRAAKVVVRTDARRRPVGHTEKPSTDGSTVVLTLDEAIQYAAETELEKAVTQTSSIAGVVVVMDPRTGEVLALASHPTFNPNRFGSYSSHRWKNRAIADAYEPGSIFKVITAAGALQEHVVDPDETLDCGNGFIEIAGQRINDHAVFERLTFRDVIARSSDVGVVRVAQRLGRESFHRYVRAFGFGAPTGVDLPGESSGLLRPPDRWSALSLASLSFGQEIGVTALQMTAAVGAIANGGYLMKPLVVRRTMDSAGHVEREWQPVAVRRVLEPETVETLTSLMKGVVRYGTGKLAAVPGYVVAGKTGTAQKVDPNGRYSMVDHVASFVGYVPASRPALVILVSLDSPRGLRNQGGDVAAPVFSRVAEQALRRLAIPPDDPTRILRPSDGPDVRRASYVPAAVSPAPTPAPSASDAVPLTLMPSLVGQTARAAALEAARRGLSIELSGSGRVVAQTPDPGTAIEPGMSCHLHLARSPGGGAP